MIVILRQAYEDMENGFKGKSFLDTVLEMES